MSRQRDRDEFIALMTQEGVPVGVARTLMRHAATLHRLAELACSSEVADRDRVPCPSRLRGKPGTCLCRDYSTYDDDAGGPTNPHGTVPRYAVREEALRARLTKLLARYRVAPVFSDDPRGAVVKLKVPSGRTNDWGQTGVCVP